ncbi:MAG: polyprenyl synthetase family protein [Armatimonadetes bacterium]|nr:polyprenyl synthetase family protein [Armatimonadota bacterium]
MTKLRSVDVSQILREYGQELDREILALLESPPCRQGVYRLVEYHLGWCDPKLTRTGTPERGKLLRPILTLLTFEALTRKRVEALPLAVAIELLHNQTLIFDDIQDGDTLRRGRATVWKIWGIPKAIGAGFNAGPLAIASFLGLKEHFPSEKVLELLMRFNETALEIGEGQYLDLSFEDSEDITPEDYLDMISRKTASLMAFCTYGAAFLASDDPQLHGRLSEFGRKLGLAMQIQDDLVGIWGSEKEAGKRCGNDIQRRKKTFPVIQALARAPSREREFLKEIYGSREELPEDKLREIQAVFEGTGAQEACVRFSKALETEAYSALDIPSLTEPAKDTLKEFASHCCSAIGRLRAAAR